jgi:chemotaxis protein CheZ
MAPAEAQTTNADIYRELRRIADYLARLKDEIGALQPAELHRVHLPVAGKELAGVVLATEAAANGIMENAESVISAEIRDIAAYKAFVNARMLGMMEACSFQDLTGQRIARVREALDHVEQRIARFAAAIRPADESDSASVEPKPEVNNKRLSQTEIDRMFGRTTRPGA